MHFTILDYYEGFILNNFIKKDLSQIFLLKSISSSWDQFNDTNIFFFLKEKN